MKRYILFLALQILLLAIAGCGSSREASDSDQPVPGVSNSEIVLGSSLALKGHAGYLGTQTLMGAMAYIQNVNENGGIYGRTIKVIAYDDGYDPPRCLDNTQRLLIDDNVFALFCYVGTPTTVKILPFVEDARIPVLGMFTGAKALRTPFNRYVINVRASYYQETEAAVEHLVKDVGIDKIAVFYQYDAYGFDGLTGTELALKKYDLAPVARGSYIRGTMGIEEGFEKIRNSGAQAVVMIGTYNPCAEFIRLARKSNYMPIFYNVSFVGAEELARRLPDTTEIVLMSQVVPPPETPGTESLLGSAEGYVHLLKKYHPQATPNFVGLEGYINARVLVEGLRRAGPNLTREKFIDAIESIEDYQLGPNTVISFGEDDHQGMDELHFTRLENGRFVPVKDWKSIRKDFQKLNDQQKRKHTGRKSGRKGGTAS